MTYTNTDQLPLLITVGELSEILGIGKNKAYELVRSKNIDSIRIGCTYRIPKKSLIDFLEG